MTPLRLLIVDDEPLIRSGIRAMVSRIPGLEVVGECGSASQAVSTIRSHTLDLVLLDVRMPDATGLDVIRAVGAERMPMVIFITAYDEYAIRAFELNAVDYLLKPFEEERLGQAIERARQRLLQQDPTLLAEQMMSLLQSRTQKQEPERLVVKRGDVYEFVPVHTIDWVESADNYVQLHCGPRTHLLNESMTGLEQRLSSQNFLRIHRCRMVNLSRIVSVSPLINGAYELELHGGLRLTSGRQYKTAIHSLLGRATTA